MIDEQNTKEQNKKMLARLLNSADGEMFLKFLESRRSEALQRSIQIEDVYARWNQGRALAYQELIKEILESKK